MQGLKNPVVIAIAFTFLLNNISVQGESDVLRKAFRKEKKLKMIATVCIVVQASDSSLP